MAIKKFDKDAIQEPNWSARPTDANSAAAYAAWLPEAKVLGAWPNDQFPRIWLVEVRCPYCGYVHTHDLGESLIGEQTYRLTHCWTGPGQQEAYKFTVTEEDKRS